MSSSTGNHDKNSDLDFKQQERLTELRLHRREIYQFGVGLIIWQLLARASELTSSIFALSHIEALDPNDQQGRNHPEKGDSSFGSPEKLR